MTHRWSLRGIARWLGMAVVGLLLCVSGLASAEEADRFLPDPASLWGDGICQRDQIPLTGDFDGNGADDIAVFVRNTRSGEDLGGVWVSLSSRTGFGPLQKWATLLCTGEQVPVIGDFDGDGRDDVAVLLRDSEPEPRAGDVYVALSNGKGFWQATKWQENFCAGPFTPLAGDVDGDGKADLVAFVRSVRKGAEEGDVYVALSGGNSFKESVKWHDFMGIGQEEPIVGDFNGDGRADIGTCVMGNSGAWNEGFVYVALSEGRERHFGESREWTHNFSRGNVFELVQTGDVNGDGKCDLIAYRGKMRKVDVSLSDGRGFSPRAQWHGSFTGDALLAGDFNGDKQADIATFLRQDTSGSDEGDVLVALAARTLIPTLPAAVAEDALDAIRTTTWGFADVHAHPASHLAFGVNDRGEGGMFWGKPGLALANAAATLASDMPPCSTDTHSGFDEDFVRRALRTEFIKMIDSLTGWVHDRDGAPSFGNWPSAESVNHQQMHILCIRRAYEGGLRLMVASAADNQMMSNLWSRIGFNLTGNPVPAPSPSAEVASAKRQFAFIKRMAAANADWMQVVYTSTEAEEAIRNNKLAIILGVEMDSLSAGDILGLVRDDGVRQVIPIHLANNPHFGGCAVYEDAFNTNNKYLTGDFFRVEPSPLFAFRLGRPKQLMSTSVEGWLQVGGVEPVDISDRDLAALGYNLSPGSGHTNTRGLNSVNFQMLMKAGLLLDLAHMGDKATDQAIELAETYQYPLMDSHTGLRPADGIAESERYLSRLQARRIAALGGMLGLGTMGTRSSKELYRTSGSPAFRFTGNAHDWIVTLPPSEHAEKVMSRLRVTVKTGGDDLRGGDNDNCDVILTMRSGERHRLANINRNRTWGGGVQKVVDLPLPTGTKVGDLATITLHTAFTGGLFGDNWNIDALAFHATLMEADTIRVWTDDYNDALRLMGGRGVALGTDFNGLSPQMPFAAVDVPYPMPKPPGAPATTPTLDAFRLGNRTYSFSRDGIAHYGMLADFLCALRPRPTKGAAIASLGLYRSAGDVIEMWKKCEDAAAGIP